MQAEQIDFTFLLFVSGVVDAMPFTVTVNDTVIESGELARNGRHSITAHASLIQGPANVSFNIVEKRKGSVRLENIKLAWINDNSGVNSAWINSEDTPNTVWCYDDAESVAQFEKIANGSHTRVISLDYVTDESATSYLRNYGVSVDSEGNVTQMKDANNGAPHIFIGTGSFILPMTSPVSYWLMERLFVAI